MDYFSRLTSTTSAAVITSLKSIFMQHGILEVLRSDNSPQYASQQFLMFAESYVFQHSTSSLRYPQSNGQAERTVKQQSSDPLLKYCATPLPWCRHSPAELLMGRRLRTHFPQLPESIQLTWSYMEEFRKQNKKFKVRQKRNFDQSLRDRESNVIPNNSSSLDNFGR